MRSTTRGACLRSCLPLARTVEFTARLISLFLLLLLLVDAMLATASLALQRNGI